MIQRDFQGMIGRQRLWLLIAVLLASGCASQQVRVDQFAAFAATGSTFTQAMDPVLTESFDATATTSALVLQQARDDLPAADRLSALDQADTDLNDRLAILRDLKRHLNVLQSYFDALAALAATSAESSGTVGVAQGLVAALGKISPRIANASIAGTRIDSLIAPAAQFVFVSHQSKVLNDELSRHADSIDRELRLQHAALSALADAYTADLEVVAAKTYRDQVALPFAGTGRLPSDWAKTRASLLQSTLDTSTIQAAADAAGRLRASFVALVENRLGSAGIAALQNDINAILTAIDKSRADRTGSTTQEAPTP
ncbi:MAG: hypothetical protein U1A22_08500 [Xanthomonadaceae bacterium]|nr:hypothetical protein [Xanthomonadaceae bacterium]